MSRKDLEQYDPSTLKPGSTKFFEVVNQGTHYHEVHYFYRDLDGELLTGVAQNNNFARTSINDWKKLKRAKARDLKQMTFAENTNGQTDHQT